MNMLIREVDRHSVADFGRCGNSFAVSSKLVLRVENGAIRYSIVDVPPYTKQYQEEFDLEFYLQDPDRAIFCAYVDEELAGEIRLRKHWNGYVYIDSVAVDSNYRRQGVGSSLIERAVEWAKAKELPGIMLETQDINVPACMLYEKCGFVLGGFDLFLYWNSPDSRDEIALYWYLMF